LARAERLAEAVRSGGRAGFEAAMAADLRYSRNFRLALRLHALTGFQGWLAHELAQRFANLMSKRSVAQRLLVFASEHIQPLLGPEATAQIIDIHRKRLNLIESALQALSLQYPSYALWLQESYLGAVAREMERLRYHEMLEQFLISGEVYADLLHQLKARWRHIDRHPPLDIELGAADLVKRVPLFQDLNPEALAAICRLLKPRLALPDQPILVRGRHSDAMCFVASGAVKVHLPDQTYIELGSGEFFGELALMSDESFAPTVTSLGYSKLLMLAGRDFQALLARDAALRERIEAVARQRLRAVAAWKKLQEDARNAPDASPAA